VTQLESDADLGLVEGSFAPQLTIEVRSAIGYGPTALAAFDDALHSTSIANFNLILLSSVIPAGASVTTGSGPTTSRPAGAWGDRLYVVMAEARSTVAGERVAAGIGWVQEPDTGKGLFVEHEGDDPAALDRNIRSSLHAMMERRSERFGPIRHHIISETTPPGSSACALVVATFESEPWTGGSSRVAGLMN